MTYKIKTPKIKAPTKKEFNKGALKVAGKALDKMNDYARNLKRRIK